MSSFYRKATFPRAAYVPAYVHKLNGALTLPAHEVAAADIGSGGDALYEFGVFEAHAQARFNVAEWGTGATGIPCIEYTHLSTDSLISGGHRSEIASYNNYFGPAYEGQTLWLGQSIIPSASPWSMIVNGSGEDIITGQVHMNGGTLGHPPIHFNFDRVSGLLRLRLHNWQTSGTLVTRTMIDFGAVLTEVPVERYDIKIQFKCAQDSSGFVNWWVRRSADLNDYTGAWTTGSGITGPTMGGGSTELYLKHGVYRPGVMNGDVKIRERGMYLATTEAAVDSLFEAVP